MTQLVFSEAAAEDRRSVTRFTVDRFGVSQARRLRDAFEAVFDTLRAAPHLGRKRPDLDPPGHGFRYFVVLRRFIVVYEVIDGAVRVARILHGAVNLARELGRDAGADD